MIALLWSKGQAADKDAMEIAAAAIIVDSKDRSDRSIAVLKRAEANASSSGNKRVFQLALARQFAKHQNWTQLQIYATDLLKEEPRSDVAFYLLLMALRELKQWPAWEVKIKDRLALMPDDLVAQRTFTTALEQQNQFEKGPATLRPIIDSGRATPTDLNQYAWDALFDQVKPDDVEFAQRAMDVEKNSFSIMHTVACLFAVTGNYKESIALFGQAMDVSGLDEPDSSIWLGMGLLAEQYGESQRCKNILWKGRKVEERDQRGKQLFPGTAPLEGHRHEREEFRLGQLELRWGSCPN